MSKYEVGDEVDLRVRVTGVSGDVVFVVTPSDPDLNSQRFLARELDEGTRVPRVPRPIKVGDRVTWATGYYSCEVLGIRDGEAWLGDARRIGDGGRYHSRTELQPVSNLVRVPS